MTYQSPNQFMPFSDEIFQPDPGFVSAMVDMLAFPAVVATQSTELMMRMSLLPLELATDVLKSEGFFSSSMEFATPAVETMSDAPDVAAVDVADDMSQPDVSDPADEMSAATGVVPEDSIASQDTSEPVDLSDAATPDSTPEDDPISDDQAEMADDLQAIRGIGPKLAQTLADMGITQYSEIAGWSPEKVQEMQSTLKPARGRPATDDWVSQAAALVKAQS